MYGSDDNMSQGQQYDSFQVPSLGGGDSGGSLNTVEGVQYDDMGMPSQSQYMAPSEGFSDNRQYSYQSDTSANNAYYRGATETVPTAFTGPDGLGPTFDYTSAPRKVVDVLWLFIFGAIICFTMLSILTILPYSNQARLYKGINYQGLTCGDDTLVADLPYLYYPLDPRESYAVAMVQDPMCVDVCPLEKDVRAKKTVPVSITDTSIDSDASSAITSEVKLQSPVYATRIVANSYCIPLDDNLAEQILSHFDDSIHHMHASFASFYSPFSTMLFYMLVALGIGTAVYYALSTNATIIVTFTGLIATIISFAGAFLFLTGNSSSIPDNIKDAVYGDDYIVAGIIGFLLLLSCGIIGVCSYMTRNNNLLVNRLIKCAHIAVDDLRILYRLALMSGILVIFLVMLYIAVSMSIISAATVDNSEENLAISENGNTGVVPLHRQLLWDGRSTPLLLLWTGLIFWALEFIFAVIQFVVCYCVTVWFFSPYDTMNGKRKFRELNAHPELVGLGLAFTYHVGSLALSAVLMPLSRPFRVFTGFASRRAYSIDCDGVNGRQYNDGSVATNNNVSVDGVSYYAPVPGSFFYNSSLYRMNYQLKSLFGRSYAAIANLVDRFSTSGFVEMSVSATGFGEAMEAANFRINETNSVVAFLHGSTRTFTTIITFAAATLSSCLLYYSLIETLYYSDLQSPGFVQAPAFVALVTFVAAAYTVSMFTTVYDTTSDVLLFCYMVESVCSDSFDDSPATKVHAPQPLKELISELQGY